MNAKRKIRMNDNKLPIVDIEITSRKIVTLIIQNYLKQVNISFQKYQVEITHAC